MISFVIKTNYKKPIVFQAGHSVWMLGLGLGVWVLCFYPFDLLLCSPYWLQAWAALLHLAASLRTPLRAHLLRKSFWTSFPFSPPCCVDTPSRVCGSFPQTIVLTGWPLDDLFLCLSSSLYCKLLKDRNYVSFITMFPDPTPMPGPWECST